jgi:hypothetical protein
MIAAVCAASTRIDIYLLDVNPVEVFIDAKPVTG